MRRIVVAMVMLATLAPALPAGAEHDSTPVWPPTSSMMLMPLAGTGETGCFGLRLTGEPQTVTVDIRRSTTSGTASASATVTCMTGVKLRVTMTVAVYRQVGTDLADTNTIGETKLVRLELLTANTCTSSARTGLIEYGCSSLAAAFSNGPGTRLVFVTGTTFEIVDPRGAAFTSWDPISCRENQNTRAKIYCFLAAEMRT